MNPGTGTVLVQTLQLGANLEELLFLFSFHKESGTIEINFSELELIKDGSFDKEKCLQFLTYIVSLMEPYEIESVKFGYEPATDADTCLIEITDKDTDLEELVMSLRTY